MPIHVTPADDLAAAIIRARDGDRQVLLHGGAYAEVALTLTPDDSGLTLAAAPGETPVLYGGRRLTGWTQQGDWWSAAVPEVRDGAWDFRHLVVNGGLRPRARLPKHGAFTHENVFDVRWMSSTDGGWERKPTAAELTTLRYRPGDLGAWLDLRNAELTIYHQWDESVVGIAALDPATRTVTFSTPAGHPPGAFGAWNPNARTYVAWNVRQGMTEPGQWYLDRTAGTVSYWPLPGEELAAAEIIAPTAARVIRLEGTEAAPVAEVTLRGLTVSATTTPLVAGGFAAGRFDGALSGAHLRDCRILDCAARAVGGQGMKLLGAERLRIAGCETADTGAGGIYLHKSRDCAVTECHIHHNGRTYPSAIGLQLSGAGHVISHNEIHHTTYSGVGSSASTTRFEANLFYDIMQVLSDGGAIYITFCADVTMRGNVVRGGTGTQLSHAYYIDEQGERCVVEGNLAVNTRWPAHNHMARGGVIRRNVFIDAGDARLTFMRCADFTVAENIIVAGGALTVSAPPTGITAMPKNVLWSGQGVITLETLPEDDYQTRASAPLAPRDGTVIADPHLNGAAFGPDSPAAALGIPPLDISAAGRSRRE